MLKNGIIWTINLVLVINPDGAPPWFSDHLECNDQCCYDFLASCFTCVFFCFNIILLLLVGDIHLIYLILKANSVSNKTVNSFHKDSPLTTLIKQHKLQGKSITMSTVYFGNVLHLQSSWIYGCQSNPVISQHNPGDNPPSHSKHLLLIMNIKPVIM